MLKVNQAIKFWFLDERVLAKVVAIKKNGTVIVHFNYNGIKMKTNLGKNCMDIDEYEIVVVGEYHKVKKKWFFGLFEYETEVLVLTPKEKLICSK